MPQEFDVVCLGGGVAGEAIAAGLRDSGLTLAVVERELVGGECPYWGCVPSKTLLRSGETLTEADRARVLAASRVEWTVDFPKISDTRAVDGAQPRRQPSCRRDGGDRGQALSRRRETDRPAHGGRRQRAAHRAPRRGDRQRQHRGDPAHPWPRHRRVLDQPPGGDSDGAAGRRWRSSAAAPLASSSARPSRASAPGSP